MQRDLLYLYPWFCTRGRQSNIPLNCVLPSFDFWWRGGCGSAGRVGQLAAASDQKVAGSNPSSPGLGWAELHVLEQDTEPQLVSDVQLAPCMGKGPAMSWQLVQWCTLPLPRGSWDWLQHTPRPHDPIKVVGSGWMDGFWWTHDLE